MPTICGYTWSEPLDAIIREEALRADVPLDIAYAIIAVESGFNPNAHNLSEIEDSVGLLQLNRRGGQGTGYTVAQLMDPRFNLQVGLPPIAAAFRAAWSPTIEPYEFIYQVATRSGHPGPVLRSDPRILRIARVWGCFWQGVGVAGPSGAPAAAAGPGPAIGLTNAAAAIVTLPFVVAIAATLLLVQVPLMASRQAIFASPVSRATFVPALLPQSLLWPHAGQHSRPAAAAGRDLDDRRPGRRTLAS